ncbi:MAG: hypothetical protein IPO77_13690 [Acidobacteria bacterium]|nr:hypothetical protein [Acidobacteriota bacterium]
MTFEAFLFDKTGAGPVLCYASQNGSIKSLRGKIDNDRLHFRDRGKIYHRLAAFDPEGLIDEEEESWQTIRVMVETSWYIF